MSFEISYTIQDLSRATRVESEKPSSTII